MRSAPPGWYIYRMKSVVPCGIAAGYPPPVHVVPDRLPGGQMVIMRSKPLFSRIRQGFLKAALGILALLLPVGPAGAAVREIPGRGGEAASDSAHLRDTITLQGGVRLHGCTAHPWEVRLRAAPATAFRLDPALLSPDGREEEGDDPAPGQGGGAMGRAILERTPDPHFLEFRIEGLRRDRAYRLGVQVQSDTCGDVRWEGPVNGLVVPGSADGVVLEGWAIRSKVEVLGLPVAGRPRAAWVGADNLDLSDPASSMRSFRWTSDLPDVTEGELQIVTERFATTRPSRVDCIEPEGLVYRRRIPVEPGGWGEIGPVDLGPLLSPTIIGPGPSSAVSASEERRPPSVETRRLIDMGAPVYARVVPVRTLPGTNATALMCDTEEDGLQGWVIFAGIIRKPPPPPPAQPPVILDEGHLSEYFPPLVFDLPANAKVCYRVIKPHTLPTTFVTPDGLGLLVALSSDYNWGQVLPVDEVFCVIHKGGGGGFFSSLASGFGDLVTGAIDAVAAMVNGVARLYDNIKKEAISALADALDALPLLNCGKGTVCRAAAGYAVQTAAVAVGLPPSLPNFDQLIDEGLDYVTAEVAAQANIPPEIANLATGKAKQIAAETINQMKARRGIPGADWVVVDEFARPATLMLNLSRSSASASVPDVIYVPEGPVFLDKVIDLPKNLPVAPASLKVPTTLIANLKEIKPPPPLVIGGQKFPPPEPGLSRWMLSHWRDEKVNVIDCTRFEGWLFYYLTPNAPTGQVFGVNVRTIFSELFSDPYESNCTP